MHQAGKKIYMVYCLIYSYKCSELLSSGQHYQSFSMLQYKQLQSHRHYIIYQIMQVLCVAFSYSVLKNAPQVLESKIQDAYITSPLDPIHFLRSNICKKSYQFGNVMCKSLPNYIHKLCNRNMQNTVYHFPVPLLW